MALNLVVALALSAASAPVPLELPAPLPDPQVETDNLRFASDRTQRMTVPVRIGGTGPYSFFIDTGAERTVISRELAERLRLQPGRSATIHSMSGVGTFSTVVIPKLDVSKQSVVDIHAPALSQTDLGGAGLLGVDSLQSQNVVFDFKNRLLTMSKAKKRSRQAASGDAIVVTARSRFGRLILADARLDGEKVWVIVDTGSQITIGNSALRQKLERKKRLRRPIVPIEIFSVTGGSTIGEYTSAAQFDLGRVRLEDMPIAFADVHPFRMLDLADRPAMLLGMDALQAFDRVSVDFLNRQVRFTLPDANAGPRFRLAAL